MTLLSSLLTLVLSISLSFYYYCNSLLTQFTESVRFCRFLGLKWK
jgi:hypothetical protein